MESEYLIQQALSFVNPLQLPLELWLGVAAAKFVAEELLNVVLLGFLSAISYTKLPSRDPKPIIKGLEKLELKDYTFLAVNQAVELIFLLHLAKFGLTLPYLPEDLNFMNTVVAFYATIYLDDFFYYFLHRFLHVPAVYPYVHKHHHRQPLPYRGYTDAANESPIEQILGLLCVWVTVQIVTTYIGFHALGLFAFFAVYAVLAYLNHTPYDIQLGFIGVDYTVRAHETHHRMLRGNYAQNTMIFDKLFGTYIDYPTRKSED